MYNTMFHSTNNPFNMTQEQLLEYAMNPDQQKIGYDGVLNKYPVLGTQYTPYDPYTELYEQSQDDKKGQTNADFFTTPEFKKPIFQEQDPNEVLIAMNVKEQADEFRRKQETLNSINSLFSPVSGNTPEERAKNANINKLLAEIDNFAIQYHLSQKQIETLKTQVLSNHLGEYIQTKNAISKQDQDRAEADAMDLARGNNDTGDAPVVRDPANGADENGIRTDVDGEDEAGGQANAPGGSPAFPPAGGGGGGGGAGGIGEATEDLADQEINEKARTLAEALESGGEDAIIVKNAIDKFRRDSWDKAFRLHITPSTSKADIKWEDERQSNLVIEFIATVLGYGQRLDPDEAETVKKIIAKTKTLI